MDPITPEEKRRDIERKNLASRQLWAVGSQNLGGQGGAAL